MQTEKVLCVYFEHGHVHDFKMFQDSKLPLQKQTKILADKGYQGITKFHWNSETPIKATKKHKLTYEEKKYNRELSRRRIVIEHINRVLKRFRILSSRYRNKQKRFGLRFTLITGIYNFQIQTRVSE